MSKAFQSRGRCKPRIEATEGRVMLSLSQTMFGGVRMSTHYQIGEFAELGGVSAKTLRFYDEIRVLRPASVDPRTGYRRYLPQQLGDLASILALKNLGMSLAQVRDLAAN